MIICDLCGETKACLQREIEGKEYDICQMCWIPIAEKLKGKGRPVTNREMVFLPQPAAPKQEEIGPLPGGPPKIWSAARKH